MTNEQIVREQIAVMPVEELAKLINHVSTTNVGIDNPCKEKPCLSKLSCRECTLRWLKKEVKL